RTALSDWCGTSLVLDPSRAGGGSVLFPLVVLCGREVEGRSFDRGETFVGVDYETGLQVAEELRPPVPRGATVAEMALRWILMFDDVT
ncbi:MAG: hypothetical protein MUQ56_04545, partial [Thermoleophilia bacterium]|nr:hypothetical protein [Thermoleophilia bacterium]